MSLLEKLKKPEFEMRKLMGLHGEDSSAGKATEDETGAKAEQANECEPQFKNLLLFRLLMVINKTYS